MAGLALLMLTLSATAILALCSGDPKRRRAAGAHAGMPAGRRRLLIIAACLPGIACLLLGESAVFMLWFAGSALIGWFVTSCFAGVAPDRPADARRKQPPPRSFARPRDAPTEGT